MPPTQEEAWRVIREAAEKRARWEAFEEKMNAELRKPRLTRIRLLFGDPQSFPPRRKVIHREEHGGLIEEWTEWVEDP